jgi:hypothetical protein
MKTFRLFFLVRACVTPTLGTYAAQNHHSSPGSFIYQTVISQQDASHHLRNRIEQSLRPESGYSNRDTFFQLKYLSIDSTIPARSSRFKKTFNTCSSGILTFAGGRNQIGWVDELG